MASTDAKPLPRKNAAFRLYCDLRLNTGALNASAAGLDSEVSKDGGAFADCTNEWTEIGTSGHGYLDLTSTEMNADNVVVQIKSSTTNAVTRTAVIYPVDSGDIDVNVTHFGGTAGTFSSGRPEANASHWGGTAVGSTEVRANLINIAGSAVNTSSAQLGVNVVNAAGTAWGSGAITAASIASDAITAAKIANGAIDAATFAADVDAEILSYIVDDATRIDASALNTLSGHDPGETIMGATDLGTGAGLTSLATQASVNTIDDFLDTEIAAIKVVTDKLSTALEDDGSSGWQFTTLALENAPAGGGGSGDWTADEKTAIKTILGVPASGTTPDVPSAGALKVIDDFLDTEVAAIKAKTDNLPASPAATGDIPAATAIADAVLIRNIDGGGNNTRTVGEALAFLRNKFAVVGTTLTVYDTDDTTPLWTGEVSTNASADPITGNDPA